MKLILASQSPRRKEILEKNGFKFEIISSNYDENIIGKKFSENLVETCAYNKAFDVYKNNEDGLIISADTVVVVDNIILGKPKDKNEAFKILTKLSNRTHLVATSICLIKNGKFVSGTKITNVTFKELTVDDIINYIEKAKPFDKAGSYGIQDKDFDFAIKIDGELDNVIGFSIELFKELLEKIKV